MPAGYQLQRLHTAINRWSADPEYEGIWEDATFTQVGALTLNTSTGIYTQAAAVTTTVRVKVENFDQREIDGSTVQPTDLKCYLTPETVETITARLVDTVTVRGLVYQVLSLYPQNGNCLHLRKAG